MDARVAWQTRNKDGEVSRVRALIVHLLLKLVHLHVCVAACALVSVLCPQT